MRNFSKLHFVCLLVLPLVIVGCGTRVEVTPLEKTEKVPELTTLEPTELIATGTPPTGDPTALPSEPTPDAAEVEVSSVDSQEALAAESVDACVECHTDKQQLIDTAAPVVEVIESESSGEG